MAERIIAIGGVPASGKTTLMRQIIKRYMPLTTFKYKLVQGLYNKKHNLYIIGIYNNELFSGTDRLSMAVQPCFIELTKKIKKGIIIFEGDRLFNQSLFDKVRCEKIVLQTQQNIIKQRHIDRQDTQTQKFKKAKQTKIKNIVDKNVVTLFDNNNIEDTKIIIQHIIKLIKK
tara:strand:- start:351 stop:866 length:516 start_codon:yes stop_codon:yes gene_type:complete